MSWTQVEDELMLPRAAGEPRWSGAHERPAQRAVETCAFDVPHDVALRFRTLCAMRGVDQARVLERLVKGWVILGLADAPRAQAMA